MSFCSYTCALSGTCHYCIIAEGVKPTTSHIEAIQEFVAPKDVKALRQFLGLASFYRRFVPNFAKLVDPLYQLTCKNEAFMWSSEVFDCLNSKLVESPVLVYPNFQKDFLSKAMLVAKD